MTPFENSCKRDKTENHLREIIYSLNRNKFFGLLEVSKTVFCRLQSVNEKKLNKNIQFTKVFRTVIKTLLLFIDFGRTCFALTMF